MVKRNPLTGRFEKVMSNQNGNQAADTGSEQAATTSVIVEPSPGMDIKRILLIAGIAVVGVAIVYYLTQRGNTKVIPSIATPPVGPSPAAAA